MSSKRIREGNLWPSSGHEKTSREISYQLLRYDKDAKKIAHFLKWPLLAKARRFLESSELVEIRNQAGVKTPSVMCLQEIEHGVLEP